MKFIYFKLKSWLNENFSRHWQFVLSSIGFMVSFIGLVLGIYFLIIFGLSLNISSTIVFSIIILLSLIFIYTLFIIYKSIYNIIQENKEKKEESFEISLLTSI
jgi:hypothetical protein